MGTARVRPLRSSVEARVLITVKTYPTPARSTIEQSCTAGVSDEGPWVRLFPIPFRLLTPQQQFKRYEWITGRITKSRDSRPESFHLDWDSIVVESRGPLPTTEKWAARKSVVMPLAAHCLCCLKRKRDAEGAPTLGLFKPHVISGFRLEPEAQPQWTAEEISKLRQPQFFLNPPAQMLEKIPVRFYYDFKCNHDDCRGHSIHCTDWEMGQSYRSWRQSYGEPGWEAAFRAKYEGEMLKEKDLHFYVGTMAGHPSEWLIVGLFYPPL